MSMNRLFITVLFVLLSGWAENSFAGKGKKVKVFILVGQSNMVGHGKLTNLSKVCKDPKKEALFKKLMTANGSWIERKDVKIWYQGQSGP